MLFLGMQSLISMVLLGNTAVGCSSLKTLINYIRANILNGRYLRDTHKGIAEEKNSLYFRFPNRTLGSFRESPDYSFLEA